MMNILSSKEFTFNSKLLSISVEHPVGNNIIHFIKYNKSPFIIQSPLLYIPFGCQQFNNHNTLDISFHNVKYSSLTKQFYDSINDIHNYILSNFNTSNKTIFSIKHSVGYPPILKTNSDNVSAWNNKREELLRNTIQKNTFAMCILHLKGIYINDKSFGFIWETLQVRLKEEVNLNLYAFIDSPTPTAIPSVVATTLPIDKYSKMLKMGISKQAVEQKKLMDGAIKKPSATDIMSGLSQLKKVKTIYKEKNSKFKKPDSNQFVIDQDTILNALKGLKNSKV